MTEKKNESTFGIYLAIFIYAILPRVQMATLSPYWNLLFNIKKSSVSFIVLGMIIITYLKTRSNKFQKINLNTMVLSAYFLYFITSILVFMIIEFL